MWSLWKLFICYYFSVEVEVEGTKPEHHCQKEAVIFDSSSLFPTSNTSHTNTKTNEQTKKKNKALEVCATDHVY